MNTRSLAFLVVLLGVSVGCQQTTTPSTATNDSPSAPQRKGDVHIRTPRVKVDVERKGTGRDVDVDVRRKDD